MAKSTLSGNRGAARRGIPSYVDVPKFMTASELTQLRRLKDQNPKEEWSDLVRQVLKKKTRVG